jgi:hypothetical protein
MGMGVPLISATFWNWGLCMEPTPQKMKTTAMAPMAMAINQEREYLRTHLSIGGVTFDKISLQFQAASRQAGPQHLLMYH